MTTTKSYDFLNRLLSISSVPSADSALSFNYANNAANQRTAITNADGSRWAYGYDALGQVTSGKKYWSDGSIVAGQQFEYAFDTIGNRKSAKAGGNEYGTQLRTSLYEVNLVNQYATRTVPSFLDVLGAATNSATVTVNGVATSRKGEYYRAELPLNNSASALWQAITNTAVLASGANDMVTNWVGNIFVPKTSEQFTFDFDGNLTCDGRWTNKWDAENRLISMTSHVSAPSGSRLSLHFAYDYQGRRISKVVSNWTGSAWAKLSEQRFIYDGWNLIAVLDGNNALQMSFRWGTDLSGSMQGAGGVGGLISMTVHTGSLAGVYFFAFDGNGNVAGLVNAGNGTLAAGYDYDPFGRVMRATGPLASWNSFRFSTKWYDDEAGYFHYQNRYLDPTTGRWLSRDPIGDEVVFSRKNLRDYNLYAFVGNTPANFVDKLGLHTWGPGYGCAGLCDGIVRGRLPIPRGYDCSCCSKAKVDEGLAALNERFGTATEWLRVLGITPDPAESREGTISCIDSAEAILQFLQPTPPCWHCFIEERGPWRWGDYSHNAIVCSSATDPSREVYFDWFGGQSEAGQYIDFQRRYPTTIRTYPERSYYQANDCKAGSGWSGDPDVFFNYWGGDEN